MQSDVVFVSLNVNFEQTIIYTVDFQIKLLDEIKAKTGKI